MSLHSRMAPFIGRVTPFRCLSWALGRNGRSVCGERLARSRRIWIFAGNRCSCRKLNFQFLTYILRILCLHLWCSFRRWSRSNLKFQFDRTLRLLVYFQFSNLSRVCFNQFLWFCGLLYHNLRVVGMAPAVRVVSQGVKMCLLLDLILLNLVRIIGLVVGRGTSYLLVHNRSSIR